MKLARWAAAAVVTALMTAGGAPARAQFSGFTGNLREAAATAQGHGGSFYGSFNFYPIASFAAAGNGVANGASGTSTTNGILTSLDFGYKLPNSQSSIEFGGWYWTQFTTGLFETHIRGFITPAIGAQFGFLDSTNGSPTYDFLAIYDLASKKIQPKARHAWDIQTGAGMFLDPSDSRTTTSLTFYVQGALEIIPHISLTAGQWYIRDRSADLNRFTLGIGYNF